MCQGGKYFKMKKLIIIAGAAGAGKSFLLQQMSEIDKNILPIIKLSTRKPREYEKSKNSLIDLIFNCSKDEIRNKCQYLYRYENEIYGIVKTDIDNALCSNKSPFVIVRDCEEIISLKNDYQNTLILYLHSGLSSNDLKKVLTKQGRDDIDIVTRDFRAKNDYKQYLKYFYLFDHVIINYFDSESLIEHFKGILRIENEKEMIIKRNFIFVLMSFSEKMKETYEEMKFAAKAFGKGLDIERIDDNIGDYKITDSILKKIQLAELLICDLTVERPNVYYELGYARGLNKCVILTAKVGTKIHFDVEHYRVVRYSSSADLMKKLEKEFIYFYSKNR